MGFLTPDSSSARTTCRALFFPDDEQWIAVVTGALNLLALPDKWEKYGLLTQEEAATAWTPFFDMFCFKQGACRVIGEIIAFAGSTSPDARWLACDGASLLRTDYPDLFTVIGTTYGAVDGTHFSLPDLRGRAQIGVGTGAGLSPRALGDSLGEEQHTLTVAEMPSHVHTYTAAILTGTATPPPLDTSLPNPFPAATGSTGGDGAHNNMQPSLAITYLIVALT